MAEHYQDIQWSERQAIDVATPSPKRVIKSLPCIVKCEDNRAFLRKLPDSSMALIVTSPPYNIGKAYEKRSSLESYVEQQKERGCPR